MAHEATDCRAGSPNPAFCDLDRKKCRTGMKPWLAAALAAAFMPKCMLCVAGYLAAGGAAVELCGVVESDSVAAWPAGLAAGALVLIGGAWVRRKKHRDVSGTHPAVR